MIHFETFESRGELAFDSLGYMKCTDAPNIDDPFPSGVKFDINTLKAF